MAPIEPPPGNTATGIAAVLGSVSRRRVAMLPYVLIPGGQPVDCRCLGGVKHAGK